MRQLQLKVNDIHKLQKDIIGHNIELQRKFTLPFTCFIFFFIGSSLGAIIRKGGFGMPVVMAIALFIVYYIIDTFGAKMAREEVVPVAAGMWLSSVLMFIIALVLSYQSSTDSSLLNIDDLKTFFKKKLKSKNL